MKKILLRRLTNIWVLTTMIMVFILFSLFVIGYLLNGFLKMPFELDSIWAGIATIGSGVVTGLGKYFIDSKYNSRKNFMPKEE